MFLYFVAADVTLIFWLNWWCGSNRQLDGWPADARTHQGRRERASL